MGIFLRQKSASGIITNRNRASAVSVGSKKAVIEKVNQLSFSNKAARRDAKKFFNSAKQGGLEKREAIDFLREERSGSRITKNNTRKVGYEIGLTKSDMKKVFSESGQESRGQDNISAKKETSSNAIKFQPRQNNIQNTNNAEQNKPAISKRTNNQTRAISHFVTAKSSIQSGNKSPAMSFKPMVNFEDSFELPEKKDSEEQDTKKGQRSIYSVLREREKNISKQE